MARKRPALTLAAWMQDHGVTQRQLAPLLNVTQPSLSRWLTGKGHPSRRHWRKLQELTGLPISAVISPARPARKRAAA